MFFPSRYVCVVDPTRVVRAACSILFGLGVVNTGRITDNIKSVLRPSSRSNTSAYSFCEVFEFAAAYFIYCSIIFFL
jgi:hypothetical protein